MLNFVLGALGMLLVSIAFVGGAFAERYLRKQQNSICIANDDETDAESKEAAKMERELLLKQQKAFHKMQNYSAETAYGMDSRDGDFV